MINGPLVQGLLTWRCVDEQDYHCYKSCFVACSVADHHLSQCWLSSLAQRGICPWNFIRNWKTVFREYTFENICKISAILYRHQSIESKRVVRPYHCGRDIVSLLWSGHDILHPVLEIFANKYDVYDTVRHSWWMYTFSTSSDQQCFIEGVKDR